MKVVKVNIFRVGGLLFVISGATGLFFWISSLFGGFSSSPIPAYYMFPGGSSLEFLKLIFIVLGSFLLSLGLVTGGMMFLRFPGLFGAIPKATDLEAKVNRLQNIVWKLLQYTKEKEGVKA